MIETSGDPVLQAIDQATLAGAARFGYAALKYGCLVFWLRDAGDSRNHAVWECLAEYSMGEHIENQAGWLHTCSIWPTRHAA